jgi:hypothetical protein
VVASPVEFLSTVLFITAIMHTFLVNQIQVIANRQRPGSLFEKIGHILAEVELVFCIWSLVFLTIVLFVHGPFYILNYISEINYTEAAFVFVIMCMAATRPVILLAKKIIQAFSRILPFKEAMSFYLSALIVGPILGSFITEPAAMTVTALILNEAFFKQSVSMKFKYATLALLLVNISIGGTLTHFAAPPVLMVAAKWGWTTPFMFKTFGYKSILAILLSSGIYAYGFRKELQGKISFDQKSEDYLIPRWWKTCIHVLFLILVVMTAHHPKIFIFLFFVFYLFVKLTKKYQDDLKLKESFLVGLFLAGLVTLGSLQGWWLQPLIAKMNETILFLSATALTALTDNAALTFLGTLVDLSEKSRYALVAGAVAGGGLTVIANAPNPVAFSLLKSNFENEEISAIKLFFFALIPTIISMLLFMLL